MNTRNHSGFTLLELLVTLPGGGGFVVWVDEDDDPSVSATMTDATDGNAAIDGGEPVIRRIASPGGSIEVFMDGGYISYAPTGFQRDPGVDAPASWSLYCDDRGRGIATGGLSAARLIQVQATGRAEVRRDKTLVDEGYTAITSAGFSVDCPD